MNRAEQAEKTTKALYGGASALGVTDPEFAAIKERLIYGEVYAEEKLSARLRCYLGKSSREEYYVRAKRS